MTKIDGLTCKKAHCRCMNLGNQCTNHHYADSCFGEKPGETWEERFRKLWSNSFNGAGDAVDEVYDDLISLVASEIQSAVEAERRNYHRKTESDFWWYEKGVEAERRRIAEEVQIMIDSRRKNTFSRNALETVLSIINQKK